VATQWLTGSIFNETPLQDGVINTSNKEDTLSKI